MDRFLENITVRDHEPVFVTPGKRVSLEMNMEGPWIEGLSIDTEIE